MKPTPRQIEAFLLRCTGMTYREVASQMTISEKSAALLAYGAAGRLIMLPPSPAIAANRTLAFRHFPRIAAKHGKTLEPAE